MTQWVKQAYSRTRGKELPGNFNSALLSELFHEQSRGWLGIAEAHTHNILQITSQWTDHATQRIIHEEGLRSEVRTILREWLDNSEKLALEELDRLVQDDRGSPLTYNHYYTDNVQKSRLDAQKTAVRAAIALVTQNDWHGKLHISNNADDIDRFVAAIESRIVVDMDQQACTEALTELSAYYKVAMKTFVDNVARQVIERHILSPLSKAFCPNSVSQLSDEALLRIGSEPEQQSAKRTRLTSVAEGLRRSLVDLQRPL